MTSRDRPACGHVRWGRFASQSTASNTYAVVIGHKKSREYLYTYKIKLVSLSVPSLSLIHI